MNKKLLSIGLGVLILGQASVSMALPPPEDIPEEILRTEIILEGRSPLTNQPLNTRDYALLQQRLSESAYPPQLSTKVRHLIFLLQVRKLILTVIPF